MSETINQAKVINTITISPAYHISPVINSPFKGKMANEMLRHQRYAKEKPASQIKLSSVNLSFSTRFTEIGSSCHSVGAIYG